MTKLHATVNLRSWWRMLIYRSFCLPDIQNKTLLIWQCQELCMAQLAIIRVQFFSTRIKNSVFITDFTVLYTYPHVKIYRILSLKIKQKYFSFGPSSVQTITGLHFYYNLLHWIDFQSLIGYTPTNKHWSQSKTPTLQLLAVFEKCTVNSMLVLLLALLNSSLRARTRSWLYFYLG